MDLWVCFGSLSSFGGPFPLWMVSRVPPAASNTQWNSSNMPEDSADTQQNSNVTPPPFFFSLLPFPDRLIEFKPHFHLNYCLNNSVLDLFVPRPLRSLFMMFLGTIRVLCCWDTSRTGSTPTAAGSCWKSKKAYFSGMSSANTCRRMHSLNIVY